MALPAAAVVGTAAGAGLLYAGYTGKKIYEAIVDEVDPDGTFSLFAQPVTVNWPGKGAKGADPLTVADEQYMADKLSGAPAKRAAPDPLEDMFPARRESTPPDTRESPPALDSDAGPDLDSDAGLEALIEEKGVAALDGVKGSSRIIIPDGQWKYEVLAEGVVKIVAGPPGSKAINMVLDPGKIAAMPDGPSKARLTRAYESIKSVAQGGQPLPRLSAPKKSATPAPAAAPTPPATEPAAAPEPAASEPAAAPTATTPDGRPYGRVRGLIQRFKDKPVEGGGAF
jgi:hypothetical protein